MAEKYTGFAEISSVPVVKDPQKNKKSDFSKRLNKLEEMMEILL